MPFHTEQAGIVGHTQSIVFSGGASGTPKALWNKQNKRKQIQAILDGGDIELFGMTYEPSHPTTEGYIKWIDYALSQNPNTRFFIALPWIDVPGFMTPETYSSLWIEFHDNDWHDLIDTLRADYPKVEIFCIPYGQSALELRNLYAAGQLPDVSILASGKEPAIFKDGKGHPAPILTELSRLVWLNAIYGVDLETYAYEPDYVTDLKSMAKSIMDAHHDSYGSHY